MRLIFDYPTDIGALETFSATKAYEDIWLQDGTRIIKALERHTGLVFAQDEIHVVVHNAQSMSGMDGVPMRLNLRNALIEQKRNALVHELAHRLLFGNGIYAPESEGEDGDEIRVFLFQGEVLRDVYGEEMYNYWADCTPGVHSDEHIRLITPLLALSRAERQEKLHVFITKI